MDWFGKLLGRDKKPDEDKKKERVSNSGVTPAVIKVKRGRARPVPTAAPPESKAVEADAMPVEEPVEEVSAAEEELAPEPVAPPPPQTQGKDNKTMIYIPGGKFIMGSAATADDGNPEKEAETKAFYIDRYPVTNAEYQKFLDERPDVAPPDYWDGKNYPDGKAGHPVVRVNWHEAVAYATWAGKRLPTEAEWEKAARGTDGRRFPWGDEFDSRKCNTHESGIADTTPVGKYSPGGDNPYGVGDMAGNVWEWVADWYDKRYKAMRGGSWHFFENHCACSARSYDRPDSRSDNYGFRCCQDA